MRQLRCGSSGSEVSGSRWRELAKTRFDVISLKHAGWAAYFGATIAWSSANAAVQNYYYIFTLDVELYTYCASVEAAMIHDTPRTEERGARRECVDQQGRIVSDQPAPLPGYYEL